MNQVSIVTIKEPGDTCVTVKETGNTVVVEDQQVSVVAVIAPGPAGPTGPPGPASTFSSSPDVDTTYVADKSVVYYDAQSAKYRADNQWTLEAISDGGNF